METLVACLFDLTKSDGLAPLSISCLVEVTMFASATYHDFTQMGNPSIDNA